MACHNLNARNLLGRQEVSLFLVWRLLILPLLICGLLICLFPW